jgi:two-component system chemotaxis response regulator CheY
VSSREVDVAHILLVEDDDDIRDLLADILTVRGHEVRTGRDGVEGLQLLDEAFPQVVVSDIDMPRLDGPGMVYRMFVENLGRENIPLIFVSASHALHSIARVIGTPYFLAKPFDPAALMALIARALAEGYPPRPLLGV